MLTGQEFGALLVVSLSPEANQDVWTSLLWGSHGLFRQLSNSPWLMGLLNFSIYISIVAACTCSACIQTTLHLKPLKKPKTKQNDG